MKTNVVAFAIKLFVVMVIIVGCKYPIDKIEKKLLNLNYIPSLKLNRIEPGSIIGGTPQSLKYISGPETCFNIKKNNLFREAKFNKKNYQFRMQAFGKKAKQLLSFLEDSGYILSKDFESNDVYSVFFTLSNFKLSYIDVKSLAWFYRDEMSSICKEYISKVGVITQVISFERIRISLYASDGVRIEVNEKNINKFIKLKSKTDYYFENNDLIIKTVHKLGYKLARLPLEANGCAFYETEGYRKNKFKFRYSSFFNLMKNKSF